MYIFITQLTIETYETAASRFSDAIQVTETNLDEQNIDTLNTVANYSAELATFVNDSNVILPVKVRLTQLIIIM